MNFFPKPPTDNLYKFMAITGTWLMAFVTVFIMYLGYLNYEIKKISAEQSNYFFHKNTVGDIDMRLGSINEGKIKENMLDWSVISDGSEREISFLNAAKKRHLEMIHEYELKPNRDYSKLFKLAEATGFMWVAYLLVSISVFCFYFGFKHWYNKVQKLNDLSIENNIKIQKLTIEKMNKEIALTKKSRGTRYRVPLI